MFLFIFNKSSAQIYPAPILRLFRGFTLIWQRHRPFWKLVQGAPKRLRREFNGKYFSACSANSAIKIYKKPQNFTEEQTTRFHRLSRDFFLCQSCVIVWLKLYENLCNPWLTIFGLKTKRR